MKIGILGGTFDPIHVTHIEIAKEALKQYALNKVWIMPTPYPPHKDEKKITDNFHRAMMVKLAIKDIPGVEFSDFELSMHDTTYTADTLTMLHELYPEDEFYFIIGSDSIAYFTNWYHPDVILKHAKLLVVKRNDESSDGMDEKIIEIEKGFGVRIGTIEMKSSAISSSFIRTHSYDEIKGMVPETVYDYIVKNGLYNNAHVNTAWSVNKISDHLKTILKESRFSHTIGVAKTAKDMAESFGVNPNKAYLAGILHDCAKGYSDDELIAFCKDNGVEITEIEGKAPHLLHAKVGAHLAKEHYGITDDEVLSAILWHTTGKPEMTKLEQIIFCADYIEPGRNKQPNLETLREIAHKDLDLLTYMILKDTVEYLDRTNRKTIDFHTREAYEYYKKIIDER